MIEPQLIQGVYSNRYDMQREILFEVQYRNQIICGSGRRENYRDETDYDGGDDRGGPNPWEFVLRANPETSSHIRVLKLGVQCIGS